MQGSTVAARFFIKSGQVEDPKAAEEIRVITHSMTFGVMLEFSLAYAQEWK